MTDNVVEFGKVKPANDAPSRPTADEVLKEAMGKYKQVTIIGGDENRVHIASTLNVEEALYVLVRATHKLNLYIDD